MRDDESLWIELSKQGDQQAYEKLYRANVGRVYALCLRLCGQTDMAEDFTQEAFIRAWQKLDKFRGESAFSSWLYRLTSNLVIGELRKKSKWNHLSFCAEVHETHLGVDTIQDERGDIERAIRTPPDQARVVLILYEYLGYQHNEIADLTGMAVGTSKTHLHRARNMLAERYSL